jgi:hypothetical protein
MLLEGCPTWRPRVPLDDPPVLPEIMSYLEAKEGGGDPLDDPPVLTEMMSCLEAKERGGDPLDEPHSAS